MLGSLVKIKERNLKLVTRTVTAKSEEQSISNDDYIPPPGHLTFVKNRLLRGGDVSAQLISLGGTRMEDGRTWNNASTLMSRTVKISGDGLDLGNLTNLKSFQVTAEHKKKTTKGSVIPMLTNAAAVDLSEEISDQISVVMYGGQYVDRIVTCGEIVTIKGIVTDALNDSIIDVTRYPDEAIVYKDFDVPDGWRTGSELVQTGEISTSRTGHCFSKLRVENGSHVILCSGGHCKPSIVRPYFHPRDCLNILMVPEMKWKQLEFNESLQRSFHSQAVNSYGEVVIVGGKTLLNGRWAKIHPLSEVLILRFNEDFSYTGTTINIENNILELSMLTHFSFCAKDNKLLFFSGFIFPEYENNNLYNFLPPIASRDKLPEFGTNLYKIDMDDWTISSCEGPENCGSYSGSMVGINSSEFIITSDPHMYLFSERMMQSPKCDLDEKFGSCSLSMVSRNRETYVCFTPSCKKVIHVKCDKSIRGKFKTKSKKLCPSCNNLDPVTWKKIKIVRLRNRI